MVIRRGPSSRFIGTAFTAAQRGDVTRLADHLGARVSALPETLGGEAVETLDPSGLRVQVVSGTHELPSMVEQQALPVNIGGGVLRANALSDHVASPPGSSALVTSSCKAPASSRRSTGSSTTSV